MLVFFPNELGFAVSVLIQHLTVILALEVVGSEYQQVED